MNPTGTRYKYEYFQLYMDGVFAYNLPSIPRKHIRLRMQSIPKKGFLSKSFRQQQDFSQLTESSTQQYSNLRPPKRSTSCREETTTKASSTRSEAPQSWYIIPQHKGSLITMYEEQGDPPVARSRGVRVRHNTAQQQHVDLVRQRNKNRGEYQERLKQEYHLLWNQQRSRKGQKNKPSPSFANSGRSPRQNKFQLVEQEESEYQVVENMIVIEECARATEEQDTDDRRVGYKVSRPIVSLKNQTCRMLHKFKPEKDIVPLEQPAIQSYSTCSHMFAMDDRDRFGNQAFPIAPKLNVPGPGTYKQRDSIENRARKVRLLEQQRKILKQWFND